jgi:hypothetical protein
MQPYNFCTLSYVIIQDEPEGKHVAKLGHDVVQGHEHGSDDNLACKIHIIATIGIPLLIVVNMDLFFLT